MWVHWVGEYVWRDLAVTVGQSEPKMRGETLFSNYHLAGLGFHLRKVCHGFRL